MSQLTTHILDTSLGRPAKDVPVVLEQFNGLSWQFLAGGTTNADGRVSDLLPENKILEPGMYRLTFDTKKYFDALQNKSFYPRVCVEFEITDASHYHVPLLLNPYGYSTYRGS